MSPTEASGNYTEQELEQLASMEQDQEPAVPAVHEVNMQEPGVVSPEAEMAKAIAELRAEIAQLKSQPKNHRPGKPTDKVYVRLGPLATFGKVPQQQHDLATILTRKMPVGQKFTEAQVFEFVTAGASEFPQLKNSRQDPTYLLRYYRSLRQDGPHAGFVARGFLSVV